MVAAYKTTYGKVLLMSLLYFCLTFDVKLLFPLEPGLLVLSF